MNTGQVCQIASAREGLVLGTLQSTTNKKRVVQGEREEEHRKRHAQILASEIYWKQGQVLRKQARQQWISSSQVSM